MKFLSSGCAVFFLGSFLPTAYAIQVRRLGASGQLWPFSNASDPLPEGPDSVRRRRSRSEIWPAPTKDEQAHSDSGSDDESEPASTEAPSANDAVPVDFYVFTFGGKRPIASSNIGGADKTEGFYTLCKDQCKVEWPYSESCGCTSPEMEFCDCIAKLLVEDLNSDFGVLSPEGSPKTFVLGQYKEVQVSEDLFDIPDGHQALHKLMDAKESSPYYRKSGHLTVWVASHIDIGGKNRYLGGTTYLDQPLYRGSPGAAILFNGGESRNTHLLSHETGHVVGFHHTAGPEVDYVYNGCPDGPVKWKTSEGPSCEPNIMGSWYDGPYCCPFPKDPASFNPSEPGKCIKNSMPRPKSPYCCGKSCSHKCPKKRPEPTFATKEHGRMLQKIFGCWRGLEGTEVPAHRRVALLANGTNLEAPWECQDFSNFNQHFETEDFLGPACFQAS